MEEEVNLTEPTATPSSNLQAHAHPVPSRQQLLKELVGCIVAEVWAEKPPGSSARAARNGQELLFLKDCPLSTAMGLRARLGIQRVKR